MLQARGASNPSPAADWWTDEHPEELHTTYRRYGIYRIAHTDPGGAASSAPWRTNQFEILKHLQAPRIRSVAATTSLFAAEAYVATVETTRASIGREVRELAAQWRDATENWASPKRRFMHRAYQRIIGLGRDALPFIIAELRDRPDDWFWALASITGEDVAAGEPNFERARGMWLQWAKTNLAAWGP